MTTITPDPTQQLRIVQTFVTLKVAVDLLELCFKVSYCQRFCCRSASRFSSLHKARRSSFILSEELPDHILKGLFEFVCMHIVVCA